MAVWSSPSKAALASVALYTAYALVFGRYGLEQSRYPYFVYLADAFLHGQLGLVQLPPASTNDLSLFHGNYFLYWPPLPAILYVPQVAALGVAASDVPVGLVIAGLSVFVVGKLIAATAEEGLADLTTPKRAWLTAFFALGTVFTTLAPYPRVWYVAQISGLLFLCAAYLAALKAPMRWAPLTCGVLVGCAFLSRSSTLLAALWVGWYLWIRYQRASDYGFCRRIPLMATGLIPIALSVGLQLGYNHLRFGSPMEMGITYHQMASFFRESYERFGYFSLHYVPINLFYNFLSVPYLSVLGNGTENDFWMGGSLFLMSPPFVLAVPAMIRSWRAGGWALAASCVLGMIPMLVLMGTGWVAYGPRYTTDIMAPLLIATAMGSSGVRTPLLARMTMIAFAMYLPGAAIFGAKIW